VEDSCGRGCGSQRAAMTEEEEEGEEEEDKKKGMRVFSQSLSRARATEGYTRARTHKRTDVFTK